MPAAPLPLLETECVDPRDLIDNENNSRIHSAAQIEGIARSIERFGFNAQVLLKDDGRTIGAGHGRRLGALLLIERGIPIPRSPDGVKIPTATLRGLTPAEWRAYVIADNQLALTSEWDLDVLAAELEALRSDDADLATFTGFSDEDLDSILNEVTANFQPLNPEEVKPLDRLVVKKCPNCGHDFRA